MNDMVVTYQGEQVSVPKEVADYLEQDRKRAQAQDRQDRRHLSKSEFETVPSCYLPTERVLENTVFKNLLLENLRKAVSELGGRDQRIIDLRYDDELTEDTIGKILGVSKMAVSKRLKKLHEKLGSSVT